MSARLSTLLGRPHQPEQRRSVPKDTLNWLTGVHGEFGEKAKPALLGALAALPETVGIGIFVVGVLRAL